VPDTNYSAMNPSGEITVFLADSNLKYFREQQYIIPLGYNEATKSLDPTIIMSTKK